MRILLSCLQSLKPHPMPAYDFWRPYFVEGCREAGIECLEVPSVDWAEGLVYPPGGELEAWRARTWDTVLAYTRREHSHQPIDFFLGYLYPKQIEIAAIDELQRMGIPAVNFFCDNVREFRQVPAEYRPFSLHWVPEFEALPMYQNANLPYLHAPMPCWVPPVLRSVPISEIEPPTFIGSADILRRDLIGRAMRAGAEFIVRGPGWSNHGDDSTSVGWKSHSISKTLLNQLALVRRYGLRSLLHKVGNRLRPIHLLPIPDTNIRETVFGQQYFQITRDATVTIGVNRVPTASASNRRPLVYSRLRDIEAPMLGACYLTEWTAGLEKLYDIGSEIETYRTPDELRLKLIELKKNNRRRLIMRERAQRRALHEHTVARSLARLREKLGV